MRAIFSIIGLVIVLVVVGLLAKKQLSSVSSAAITLPVDSGVVLPVTTPGSTPQQQSQQIQEQVKKSLEAAMQARPMPDDK
jgi:hypothetical protein